MKKNYDRQQGQMMSLCVLAQIPVIGILTKGELYSHAKNTAFRG